MSLLPAAGAASAIGHALRARFRVGNGVAKAIVLPHTLRFNAPVTRDRLDDLADTLDVPRDSTARGVSEALSCACREFFDRLELPARLRDVNVPHDALPAIADDVQHDWFFAQNPRAMRKEELIDLLEAAW